jgi:hypothetical protein
MEDNDQSQKPGYDIGYKKPPAHTRFKVGQSGNIGGRKKKSHDLKTDLKSELYGTIAILEGGKKIKLTRQQALIKSLTNRGIKGDRHAVRDLLTLIARSIGMEGSNGPTAAEMSAEDKEILKSFLKHSTEGEGK